MKSNYSIISILSVFLIISFNLKGQITITTDNMPDQGDTIRVSKASYPVTGIPDPSLTGFDFYWDYSSLEPVSQEVQHYINPNQTPFLYQLIFSPSVTNLAKPIEGLDFFDFQVTDAYEYYKNNSSEYVRAGFAASIMGLPVPMKYNQPERLFKFPLSINSEPDSSISELEVQYPSVAYFNLFRKRINSVDGSGTLITPYGSFNTIRVKSVIYERDSLYLDSLQTGVPIVRNIIEYKWLSPDFHEPLLTISAEGFLYSVQYLDSVRNIIPFVVNLGDDITLCQGDTLELNAQVQGGHSPYTYLWNTMDTSRTITVVPQETATYNVTVIDSDGNFISDQVEILVTPFGRISLGNDTLLCAGHEIEYTVEGYYNEITWFVNNVEKGTGPNFSIDSTGIGLNQADIRVDFRQDQCTGSDEAIVTFYICDAIKEIKSEKLSVLPNPATDKVLIESAVPFENPRLVIVNSAGNKETNYTLQQLNGRIYLEIGKLSPGIYFISVEDKNGLFGGKLIKN